MIQLILLFIGILYVGWDNVVFAERGNHPNIRKISTCNKSKTTICTIEIWLAYQHKKNDKVLRQRLKDRSIKVIRKTIQFWKRRGGHPPPNIAIGAAISAEDARYAIDLALELNDEIEHLVIQRLNPPHYVAIGTSAWDEKSLIPITPANLKRLRDTNLDTQQFHRLYVELTGEYKSKNIDSFY